MIGDEGNKITYRVEYRTRQNVLAGDVVRHEERIDLYPGYSSLGDIPAIIGTTIGVKAEDIVVVYVDLVGITIDGVRR